MDSGKLPEASVPNPTFAWLCGTFRANVGFERTLANYDFSDPSILTFVKDARERYNTNVRIGSLAEWSIAAKGEQ
jgi:hypothetical protein